MERFLIQFVLIELGDLDESKSHIIGSVVLFLLSFSRSSRTNLCRECNQSTYLQRASNLTRARKREVKKKCNKNKCYSKLQSVEKQRMQNKYFHTNQTLNHFPAILFFFCILSFRPAFFNCKHLFEDYLQL